MSTLNVQAVLNLTTPEDQPAQNRGRVDPAPILSRIRFLPERDQHLLTLALSGNHSFRQMAALLGSNPGSICRRASLLCRRLSQPIVIALLERPMGLGETYQRVGLDRFLFKRGVRAIARATDLSEREIRTILIYLERWLRMSGDLKATKKPKPLTQPA